MARQGRKFTIDERKLKALFPAMLIAPQIKYIAYALGVRSVDTIKSWIASGEALQDQYSDKLGELDDIFPFEFEPYFENRKLEYDAEFRAIHSLEPEVKIADRMYNEYKQFMLKAKRKFIEGNISRKEQEILENIEFTGDKDIDAEFRLLIRFARIYKRGVCVVELGYIDNINTHSSTSKNVALSMKMLEKMNKEDFADVQTVNHTGMIDVQTKSILALALQSEKELKEKQLLLDKDDTNVIDVKPIKQIEEKQTLE